MKLSRRPVRTQSAATRLLACVLLAATTGMAPAAATSYVGMTDRALFDRAQVVVEGRVVAVEPAPDAELPAIHYRVAVERRIKGAGVGPSLVVRVPGGVRADGVGLMVRGAPRFAAGEEVLLFLSPRRDGTFALHQLMLGAFHVEQLGDRKVARRDLEGAVEVRLPGRKVTAPGGARDAVAFRRWLSDRVAGRERPADYFLSASEAGPQPESELREKYVVVTSTDEPPPAGCGAAGGRPVRWFEDRDPWPVSWRLHTSGQPGLFAGGLTEFQLALDSWAQDPMTPVRYLYTGRTTAANGLLRPDAVNAVVFEDPNDEIGGSFADGGILAIGGPWFLCGTETWAGEEFHPIIEADIVTQDGARAFFEAIETPSEAAQELFAHELGHTLGLDHSRHREALMRALIHNDGRGASFDVDDLAGSYYLYGRSQPDLRAPAAPSELAATADGFDLVELRWTDNSSNESHFRIERRRLGELNFSFVKTVPSGRDRFVDSVEPEAAYTYRVIAQNAAGRSPSSELVRIEMPPDLRPDAPSHLWSTAVSQSRVLLTWQDNSDDEASFVVEMERDGAFFELPFTVAPNVNAVELFGLAPGQSRTFRLRARNAFGRSGPSNATTVETFAADRTCVSRDRTLCLKGGRFEVEVDYVHPAGGDVRPATVLPLTNETGLFWFFGEGNPELVFRSFDLDDEGSVRIVFADLSDVGYQVTVTDHVTGEVLEVPRQARRVCALSSSAELVFSPSPEDASRGVGRRLAEIRRGKSDPEDLSLIAVSPAPGKAGAGGSCRRDPETLCVQGGRFAVRLEWMDPDAPETPRSALALAGLGSSGFFSFDDPSQPDVVFKLLDGRPVNGHFWVFASASLAPVSYQLSVTDSVTGARRVFSHKAGSGCGVADIAAFPDSP